MVCSKCGGDIDYTAYEPLAKILKEREEAKRAERERVKAEKAAQREKARHERAASRERKHAERDERKALAGQEKRRDLVETNASPAAMQNQAEGPSTGHRKLALIACPECKKKISDTAGNCPNCGYQLTPEKVAELKKQQQVANGCAIGCLSVIAVFVILILWLISGPAGTSNAELAKERRQEAEKADNNKYEAWEFMKGFVKKRGGGGGSACVEGLTTVGESGTTPRNDRYRVSSYVDSQNSFGAMIRTSFTGVIKEAYGGWELESLVLSP